MNLKNEIELWISRGGVKNVFPREIGLYRNRAGGIYELFRNNVVYSAIFSEWQKDNLCYDTIFIDVDEHNYELSFDERMNILDDRKEKIIEKFERCGIELRVYFTGNGYHIYCDFAPMKFKSKYIYKEASRRFLDEVLGDYISLVDFKIVGDVRRVARLPGKKHSKTKLYSIRIDKDWDWEKCVLKSSEFEGYEGEYKCNDWLSCYLSDLSKDIKDKSLEGIEITNSFLKEIGMNPACIDWCLAYLVTTGELPHQARLFMVSWLLVCGVSVDDVVKIFEMYANDFNREKTKYQVQSILKAKGYFYSCRSMKEMGFCPFGNEQKKCPFYVLSGGWLRRLVDSKLIELLK